MESVEQLKAEYKHLEQLWALAEQRLKDLHTPVECYIPYAPHHVDVNRRLTPAHNYLGWIKLGNQWRLSFTTALDTGVDEVYVWRPIAECSIDIRKDDDTIDAYLTLKTKVEAATAGYLKRVTEVNERLRILLDVEATNEEGVENETR